LLVSDLHVEFRTPVSTVKAVNGVSFPFNEGETLAILGESGSGKSVTAEAIMGLTECPPGRVRGSVLYRGTDLFELTNSERRQVRGESIAMIFQEPLAALDPGFSVGYQISEALRVRRGMSAHIATEQAMQLMERVRIPAARERAGNYPHQFSGGMAQRVMIAMALALDPDILIADEPTTALDVTIQAQIMKLLSELQSETGMGLILISHNLGIVADVADRVAVMYAGRIVESGPILDIYRQPAHPYTAGLMQSIPRVDRKGNRLCPIPGVPPDPSDIPAGCAFHPRCSLARKKCREEVPVSYEVSAFWHSSCHFFEEALHVC
jgi:oligopeptide/dipeptide ABC transporter ATP-binding protein